MRCCRRAGDQRGVGVAVSAGAKRRGKIVAARHAAVAGVGVRVGVQHAWTAGPAVSMASLLRSSAGLLRRMVSLGPSMLRPLRCSMAACATDGWSCSRTHILSACSLPGRTVERIHTEDRAVRAEQGLELLLA